MIRKVVTLLSQLLNWSSKKSKQKLSSVNKNWSSMHSVIVMVFKVPNRRKCVLFVYQKSRDKRLAPTTSLPHP